MHSNDELEAAFEALRQEIYGELRFTLQFSMSHHFLLKNEISDLPPQFNQLRLQMIQSFWGMLFIRLLLFFDKDGACSLLRFINYSFNLKKINAQQRDLLIQRLEDLRNSEDVQKAESLRSKVIAHSDRKKPEDARLIVSPIISELEAIFAEAGGSNLDTEDLEQKLEDTWGLLFDVLRLGMTHIPNDWQSRLPPTSPA